MEPVSSIWVYPHLNMVNGNTFPWNTFSYNKLGVAHDEHCGAYRLDNLPFLSRHGIWSATRRCNVLKSLQLNLEMG